MLKLRQYQATAIDELLKYKKGCMEACCGAGKSIMIAEIARRLQDKKILMIVPSKELCEQNLEKLTLLGVKTSVYSASMGQKELSQITLGTPLSLVKAPKLDFDVLMIDEAQNCPIEPPEPVKKRVRGHWQQVSQRPTYWKIIDKVKPERIYGFTGTPYRICSKSQRVDWGKFYTISKLTHIGKLWKNMVCCTTMRELQDMGFLSRTNYHVWDVDYSRFSFTAAGELKPDDVKQFENETSRELLDLARKIVAERKSFSNLPPKVVIFVTSIQYVEYIAEQLNGMGIKAAPISSKTKKRDREQAVQDFRTGDLDVLVNDTVIQVGFDSPNITDIIWAKVTGSPTVYVQSVGRGLRKMDGKDFVQIYDMAGTYNKFGAVEDIMSIRANENWEVVADGEIISGKEVKRLIQRKRKLLDN